MGGQSRRVASGGTGCGRQYIRGNVRADIGEDELLQLAQELAGSIVAGLASPSPQSDPRTEPAPARLADFIPLFNGRDLDGWRRSDKNRTHSSVKNGHLFHDGVDWWM